MADLHKFSIWAQFLESFVLMKIWTFSHHGYFVFGPRALHSEGKTIVIVFRSSFFTTWGIKIKIIIIIIIIIITRKLCVPFKWQCTVKWIATQSLVSCWIFFVRQWIFNRLCCVFQVHSTSRSIGCGLWVVGVKRSTSRWDLWPIYTIIIQCGIINTTVCLWSNAFHARVPTVSISSRS